MLDRIRGVKNSLRKSEQKVANAVIEEPESATQISLAALAAVADVSEPTVLRFVRALGCRGFGDFKVKLARSLAKRERFFHSQVSPDDSMSELSHKLFDSAIASLVQVRDNLQDSAIEKAVAILEQSHRIEFYGLGGSGVVALDAQQKFFRLGKPVMAYSDPHIHHVAAGLLDESSVVVAISHGGRTRMLIESVETAKIVGAKVIAITASGSPLAEAADVTLAVDVVEDSDSYAPVKSRLAQLAVLDVLAIALACRDQATAQNRLNRAHDLLADKYITE
ncbi:MAG: SIS domain-containing protein [Gammaproteobacteria bacterium]|nr:SIS domain-containing protein [Gammaproteobacteria bacterium]